VENLEALAELISNTRKNTIIIGDFNLPGIDWEEGRAAGAGKRILDAATAAGMEQMVKFPTHNKGNILDLILTDRPEKFITVQDVGCLGSSDHCIILAEVETKFPRQKQVTRIDWKRGDYEEIRQELKNVDWEEELRNMNMEEAWLAFKNRLTDLVHLHVPRIVVKGAGRPRWLTREIKNLLNIKRKKWRLYKRDGGDGKREEYLEAAKKVKKALIREKRKLEKRVANSNDRGGKEFNKYIRSKTKAKAPVGPLKNEAGNMLTDDAEIAEELNKYFASVFTREDLSEIPSKEKETEAELNIVEITEAKVIAKIKNLRADSAAGPDGIFPRFLRDSLRNIKATVYTF
jgi:hypothetical protein